MGKKRRKVIKEEEIIVEVQGLPFSNNIEKIINYVVLGLCLLTLVTMFLPVIHTSYTLSTGTVYRSYLVSGFHLIIPSEVAQNIEVTTTKKYPLMTFTSWQMILSYALTLLSMGVAAFNLLNNEFKHKKMFYLLEAVLFGVAVAVFATSLPSIYDTLRGISSNLIKEIKFAAFGILYIVFMSLCFLATFYEACAAKIVKNSINFFDK